MEKIWKRHWFLIFTAAFLTPPVAHVSDSQRQVSLYQTTVFNCITSVFLAAEQGHCGAPKSKATATTPFQWESVTDHMVRFLRVGRGVGGPLCSPVLSELSQDGCPVWWTERSRRFWGFPHPQGSRVCLIPLPRFWGVLCHPGAPPSRGKGRYHACPDFWTTWCCGGNTSYEFQKRGNLRRGSSGSPQCAFVLDGTPST